MKSLQSQLLLRQKGLFNIFTSRQWDKSKNFNLAFHVGDDEKNVLLNHNVLAKKIGYNHGALVHMRQIHSDKVVVVDEHHSFAHPPECDAIVTNLPHRPLMVMTADCTPLLLYDTQKKVIAAVHAGRAGAFNNITAKTVETMQKCFGSDPGDILTALGPSIGKCCYKVGETVKDEAAGLSFDYAIYRRDGCYFLDINAIIKKQLHKAGVKLHHIEEIRRCNSCENDLFFSYRADGEKTGRMAGIIMLNNSL